MLARLPHIRQLLLQLVKHGRAKEVEQLCAGLMHLCTLLPLQAAQQLSAWTLDCCELEDAQAWLPHILALKTRAQQPSILRTPSQWWCWVADCAAGQRPGSQGALRPAPGPCRSV